MFIKNKYYFWYTSIIEKAKNENYDIFERHHIIPKSIGGTDDSDNIINLTPKQHFICHLLLTKCTENKNRYKMIKSFYLMSKSKKVKSRLYERYKSDFINSCKGPKNWTIDGKKRLSEAASKRTGDKNHFYGKKHTKEAIETISQKKKGSKPPNTRKVFAEGFTYKSVSDCARKIEKSPALILHRIKSEKYNYYYI